MAFLGAMMWGASSFSSSSFFLSGHRRPRTLPCFRRENSFPRCWRAEGVLFFFCPHPALLFVMSGKASRRDSIRANVLGGKGGGVEGGIFLRKGSPLRMYHSAFTCSFRSATWRGPAPCGRGRGGRPCRRPCPRWACGRRRCPSRPARRPGAAIRRAGDQRASE